MGFTSGRVVVHNGTKRSGGTYIYVHKKCTCKKEKRTYMRTEIEKEAELAGRCTTETGEMSVSATDVYGYPPPVASFRFVLSVGNVQDVPQVTRVSSAI